MAARVRIESERHERGAVAQFFYVLYVVLNLLMVIGVLWTVFDWYTFDSSQFTAGRTPEYAASFEAGMTFSVLFNIGLTLLVWAVLAAPLRWLSRPRLVRVVRVLDHEDTGAPKGPKA